MGSKARAITPSARSPTCSTISPPTISFFQTDHPGIFRRYLRRSPPLINPIVPLPQPLIDHRHIPIPSNRASLPSPHHRTLQHQIKLPPRQIIPQLHRSLPPVFRQRNIRPAGVLPAQTPLRLTMPHQPKLSPCPHRHRHPFRAKIQTVCTSVPETGCATRIRIGCRLQYVSDRHTHSIGPNSKYRSQMLLNVIFATHMAATA